MEYTAELEYLRPDEKESSKTKSSSEDSNSDTDIAITDDVDGDLEEERGVWPNKLEFFLAIMGYTVGIGSVWRFPIICRYVLTI